MYWCKEDIVWYRFIDEFLSNIPDNLLGMRLDLALKSQFWHVNRKLFKMLSIRFPPDVINSLDKTVSYSKDAFIWIIQYHSNLDSRVLRRLVEFERNCAKYKIKGTGHEANTQMGQ
ncbi:hypothetical protein ACTXT7_003913 [Hymenolepis weldensis]